MKIPQNIREKLPEDFDDNWDPIEWKDIKVMDYISYFAKARKYVHGQYAGKEVQDRYVKGGYVSFIPDEGKAKIAGAEGKNIIGFRYGNLDSVNRGRAWSVRSAYKKYAKELGIHWEKDWNNDQSMLWENIPDAVEKQLREHSKKKQREATKIQMPSKHKYAFVLGATKAETKKLRREFETRNAGIIKPYPKERGK